MSITLNLYYKGKNGNARKFVEEMERRGVADAVRAEEGNEKYEYFIPLNDPETVLLIDRWRDQEALDRHHALPLMKEIADLRNQYDLHMTVERFQSDEAVPDQDRKYIRE